MLEPRANKRHHEDMELHYGRMRDVAGMLSYTIGEREMPRGHQVALQEIKRCHRNVESHYKRKLDMLWGHQVTLKPKGIDRRAPCQAWGLLLNLTQHGELNRSRHSND